jgi:ubiquinone/menaquinone biosynthesis C-methylase UbiE
MGLPDDYFADLKCGDIGCGSAVHGTANLLSLGAGHVNALDLDESFLEPARDRLELEPQYDDRWSLDIGSLMSLPYESNSFDFILCAGVIHHVADDALGLEEIYRVLKDGAKAYLSVTGGTGILNRFWMEIARDEYVKNHLMQEIVRGGNLEDWLKTQLENLRESIDDEDHSSYRSATTLINSLLELIDNDLVLSIVDVLEAPKYKTYTEDEWFELLRQSGFQEIYRFFKRPKYKNVRKIVSPLYYDYQNPLARVLYGDGSMNVVVTK